MKEKGMRVKIKPLLLVLALCMAHALILSFESKQAGASPTASAQPVEQWNKTFGGSNSDYAWSVQQTSDGGYILAGGTCSFGAGYHDVYLIKIDSSGGEEWSENFGGADDEDARSVQQTSDGGYILTGYTKSYGSGESDAWLIKTDSSGNKEWDKTFGGSANDYGYSVRQTSDGGYIIAGETWSSGGGGKDAWLIRTDSSGNKEWDKTFGGINGEWTDSVQQTSDGGYILAGSVGYHENDDSDALLIKTDSNGNEEWTKKFGGSDGDMGKEVQQTSDGSYILGGMTQSFGGGGWDFWLVKTDSSGNEEWSENFGGSADDEAFSVQQTSDGGYILLGKTQSFGAGGWDAWLVKTDSSGNEEWSKTFGGSAWDEAFSVLQISDGYYIFAGKTRSSGAGLWDVWLVKLGPEEKPPVTSPTTSALASVYMLSSDEGWAVGEDGTIVRWDGSSWSTVTSPTGEFIHSIHMLSPTDGWAVGISSRTAGWAMGTGGRIIRWNGSSWSTAAEPTTNSLYSIYMVSSTDGWAVGEYGTITRWNGSSWSAVTSPAEEFLGKNEGLYSVYMLSSTDGWAVGYKGTILRWNGTSWSTVTSPTKRALLSVYMLSSTDGWAVGCNGTIIRWNGTSWENVTSPTRGSLASVCMLSSTDGWAVGYGGRIIRWDGTSWSNVTSHTENTLYSVYMTSSTDGWAVGYGGAIIRIPPAPDRPPTVENQKAEGQTDPTNLTTLTPSLSWDYYDANNDPMEAVWVQVGASRNDNSLWDYTSTRRQELGAAVYNEPFDNLDSFDFSNPGGATVEIDPPGQLRYYNSGEGPNRGESWGHIYGWEIPENFTFEIKTYFDRIDGGFYYNLISTATLQFAEGFKKEGLSIITEHVDVPNWDTWELVLPGAVKYGEDAEWQTWKFVVTGEGIEAASCDIYLTDSTHTNQLMAENVACNGLLLGGAAAHRHLSHETSGLIEVHVDYCKIYYDSGQKTVDLTPSVTYAGSELSLGTTYHWRVKCYDGYEWSSWAYGTFKTVADTDGDGMPDTWESQYGLDPNTNDASQDKDGDGYTNLQEYQAGTNPALASSYPGAGEGEGVQPGEGIPVVYVVVGVVALVAVIGSVFALKKGTTKTVIAAIVIVVVVVLAAGVVLLTRGPEGEGEAPGAGPGGAGTATYSGNASGTVTGIGDVSGTIQLTVNFNTGAVSGSFTVSGVSIDATGTVSDGAISIEGTFMGYTVTLSGNISSDGSSVSGTWQVAGGLGSGTWSGTRVEGGDGEGITGIMYSGNLSGTVTGMGDASGTFQLTVDFSAGTVSGSFTIAGILIDATGTVSDGVISIEETLMGYTISFSGNVSSDGSSVSGTWQVAGGLGSGTWSGTRSA